MDLRFMPKLCAQADICSMGSHAMFLFQKAYFLLVCAEGNLAGNIRALHSQEITGTQEFTF